MIDPETAEIGMAFAKVSGELRGLTTEINDGTNLLPQENFLHHGKQKASSEPGKSFGDLGFTAEEVISEKRFLLELSPEGGKNGFVCMEKLKDSGGIFPKLFSSAVPGNFFPFHVKNSNSNKIPAKRMKDFRIQVPLSGEGFDGNGRARAKGLQEANLHQGPKCGRRRITSEGTTRLSESQRISDELLPGKKRLKGKNLFQHFVVLAFHP